MPLGYRQAQYLLVLALVLGAVLAGAPVGAVTPTDFDGLSLGQEVASSLTTTFMTPDLTSQAGPPPFPTGTVEGTVFFNQQTSTYTYALVVTPSFDNPLEFNTGFTVEGFNGVAGYSFSNAGQLGSSDSSGVGAFDINLESDGSIDYNVAFGELFIGFWSGPNLGPMIFFFQSTQPPINGDSYNLRATHVGSAVNYAPAAQAQVLEVPVDIKPRLCPNFLNVNARWRLQVAIVGTADFDVTTVDTASIRLLGDPGTPLLGVVPLRIHLKDLTTPFQPFVGKQSEFDCTRQGRDGIRDLFLKFDNQEVEQAIEAELGRPVVNGEVFVVLVTGTLLGGTPILGEDVIVIKNRGNPITPLRRPQKP